MDRILQVSDIHIRKLQRHQEFREVFKDFYKKAKKCNPDLIIITGDIVHSKLELSPEQVSLVSEFFQKCCEITQTVIIPGNHDVLAANTTRQDALSPIVNLLQESVDNLYYWKDSGKYTIDNVDFGVLSVLDRTSTGEQNLTNLPKAKDLDNEYKIALYHGGVGSFTLDTGLQMENKLITLKTFENYDFVMLGDIHKQQFLNENKTVGYPGSILTNTYGELDKKGFYLWHLKDSVAKFIELKNDYAFEVINVVEGKIIEEKQLPLKGHVKIRHTQTNFEDLKEIQLNIRKQYPDLTELRLERQDSALETKKNMKSITIENISNVKFQNNLIREYLNKEADEKALDRIFEINKMNNNTPEIASDVFGKNLIWKLKSFEFEDMFSYGNKNKVDFTKLQGVVGIIAENAGGKSSFLDSIIYTIYDTCSRTYKAAEVMNRQKQTFKSKLNLEIDGEDYWIERSAKLKKHKKRKTGKSYYFCPVSVKFYKMELNGEMEDLTGAARRSTQYGKGTNEKIKKILGTFDDFILTSLSLQTNNIDFIDKKQNERKQILAQFMGIDIFDKLYDIAKEDYNEKKTVLKNFNKKDSLETLANIETKIEKIDKQENKLSENLTEINKQIKSNERAKFDLASKLWKVDIDDYNIEKLESLITTLDEEKEQLNKKLEEDIEYKETLRPLYLEYHKKLDQINEEQLKEDHKEFLALADSIKELNNQITVINNQISSKKEVLEELNKHNFDEQCEYCVRNAQNHITQKTKIKKELEELEIKYQNILSQKNFQFEAQVELGDIELQKQQYDTLIEEVNQVSKDAIKINAKIEKIESRLEVIASENKSLKDTVEAYYDSAEKIKENKKYFAEIDEYKEDIKTLTKNKVETQQQYKIVNNEFIVLKKEAEDIQKNINEINNLEQALYDYELYLSAMSRDGIQYQLISQSINDIEDEVNRVLENMRAKFSVDLRMGGKNIKAYINNGVTSWNLELASGMEKFMSNLAIRLALIKISSLPKPSFFVMDEGLGVLDGENLMNMEGVFDFMKTQFDFILIISHIDLVKDYMDITIPIIKKNGFSHINY